MRLGSTSRPAGPGLIAELQRSSTHVTFDQQPVSDLSIDSLDKEKSIQLFRQVKKELNEDKLRSLGVLVSSANRLVPSIGGLILFGKEQDRQQYFPDAQIGCARFLGDNKAIFLDRYEMNGSIIDAVDEVPKFIARNTRLAAEIGHVYRRDIPEYPQIALREALINALVHCDYSISGSRIQVAIFDTRLEIQNPGMFPFGFTFEDFKSGVSRVRNRVITRVFHELKLMEEWGSGYRRIMEACQNGGYPEPKWEELGTTIRVTFYPHSKASLDRKEKARDEINELTDRQKAILNLFQPGETLSFQQISEKLASPISDRTLRYDLAQLKDSEMLIPKGKGRSLVWLRRK